MVRTSSPQSPSTPDKAEQLRSSCYVFVYLDGQPQAVPAGILTIEGESGRERASSFVYGDLYRARPNAISLDPVELPLPSRSGQVLRPREGNALFGAFRDAAPDAWGRLVINERYLSEVVARGAAVKPLPTPNMFDLPEMEYLLRARKDRVGALDFRLSPTDPEPIARVSQDMHLEDLLDEANRIARSEPASQQVMTLLHPSTGMGGARPKVTLEFEGQLWLAKFPIDGESLPITRIEAAMLDLANRCDARACEARLIEVEGSRDPVLLVKRFDRLCDGEPGRSWERPARLGYCSGLTVLGLDEFSQSRGSYEALAQVLRQRGGPRTFQRDCLELFRRMCLNVLINNDDDHLRNHGFLTGAHARLELTPAFDLVPRVVLPGVNSTRRQAIAVGALGREGSVRNLLSRTEAFGLSLDQARQELIRIAAVVQANWRDCLRRAGVADAVIEGFAQTFSLAEQVPVQLAAHGEDPLARDQPRP